MICKEIEYIYYLGNEQIHRVLTHTFPKWHLRVYSCYYDENDILLTDELFDSYHFSKDTLAREFWKKFPDLKSEDFTVIKHFSLD